MENTNIDLCPQCDPTDVIEWQTHRLDQPTNKIRIHTRQTCLGCIDWETLAGQKTSDFRTADGLLSGN